MGTSVGTSVGAFSAGAAVAASGAVAPAVGCVAGVAVPPQAARASELTPAAATERNLRQLRIGDSRSASIAVLLCFHDPAHVRAAWLHCYKPGYLCS